MLLSHEHPCVVDVALAIDAVIATVPFSVRVMTAPTAVGLAPASAAVLAVAPAARSMSEEHRSCSDPGAAGGEVVCSANHEPHWTWS